MSEPATLGRLEEWDMTTSRIWRVVEEWQELVPFPPNQSKIAEYVGVSRSAVSDWKSGKVRPGPEHLHALGKMMEPQLGDDVYLRLSLALLRDMGYTRFETSGGRIRGAFPEAEADTLTPPGRAQEHDKQPTRDRQE